MTQLRSESHFASSRSLMTDMIIVGRARAISAAETLDLRDNIERLNVSKGEAKESMKIFGQGVQQSNFYEITTL